MKHLNEKPNLIISLMCLHSTPMQRKVFKKSNNVLHIIMAAINFLFSEESNITNSTTIFSKIWCIEEFQNITVIR